MTSGRDGLGARGVAVVLTALEVEYTVVREHLSDPLEEHVERGTLYQRGTFLGPCGAWTVALAQTGAGNTTAGVALERAITAFSPRVVLFVGVAGARKDDVALGDVVAANAIYDYESGKDTDGDYLPRIKTHSPSHFLVQRAQAVARDRKWQQRIQPARPDPPPEAVIGPVAAGAKVVAHRRSRTAQHLDRYCEDAVAVEMEGYGFLHGAYVNAGVDALVIRGISDRLTDKTLTTDRHWQPRAAAHAAAFAFELLDTINTPARAVERDLLVGEPERRIAAVRELGSGHYVDAVPLLVRGFNATEDPDVSSRIIWALGGLGTATARAALRTLRPRNPFEQLLIQDALAAWQE